MSKILVLGAGPAAIVSALLLKREGHEVEVIGRLRRLPILEGASPRVVEGFQRSGCCEALQVVGPRWQRGSAWSGQFSEANGEHVVERSLLDAALLDDLERAGIGFLSSPVVNCEYRSGGWLVECGTSRDSCTRVEADFLVEARGRSAPKWSTDLLSGPASVALTRYFRSSAKGYRRTLAESFAHGWAWSTQDASGMTSIQLVVSAETLNMVADRDLAILHSSLLGCLRETPERLGGLEAVGEISVRGVQPVLRDAIVDRHRIRIGDAAMCIDPLSGHGMYEAIASAFAAVPVINTVLRRSGGADLAQAYYRERARQVFQQRCQAGREMYRAELRWPDNAFWQARQHWPEPPLETQEVPSFSVLPVVEDSFIVPRRCLVTRDHPRGVRFISGVDLAKLHDALHTPLLGQGVIALASELDVTPSQLAAAWHWLWQVQMAPQPKL